MLWQYIKFKRLFHSNWQQNQLTSSSFCPCFLRLRGTALCWVCALVPPWTAVRWGHLSGWPATWSPGAPPNPLLTFTIETAWARTMARSTPLWVQSTVPPLSKVGVYYLYIIGVITVSGCSNGAVPLPATRKVSCHHKCDCSVFARFHKRTFFSLCSYLHLLPYFIKLQVQVAEEEVWGGTQWADDSHHRRHQLAEVSIISAASYFHITHSSHWQVMHSQFSQLNFLLTLSRNTKLFGSVSI